MNVISRYMYVYVYIYIGTVGLQGGLVRGVCGSLSWTCTHSDLIDVYEYMMSNIDAT